MINVILRTIEYYMLITTFIILMITHTVMYLIIEKKILAST